MREYRIVLESLRAQKARTALLLLTVAVAFLIYGLLRTLHFSLNSGADEIGRSRLIVISQGGLTEPLPLAYLPRIKAVPGVALVGHATWFGAYYRSQKQMLMAFAVDGPTWLQQHPDMRYSAAAAHAFLSARDGMLVAEPLARSYGWRVGDLVPLGSVLFPAPAGEGAWPFRVSGYFRTTEAGGGRNYIIMHYGYMNDNRPFWRNTVGSFMVTAKPGTSTDELGLRVDEEFATSDRRTATATDQAFHSAFFSQFGNVALFIKSIVLVSFLSMLLVVGSTLVVTIRQRTADIGVLKVLGYSNPRILRLLLGETLALVFVGGAAGLLAAGVAFSVLAARLPTFVPDMMMPGQVVAEGCGIMVAVALAATLVPAVLVLGMRPVNALAKEG